MNTSNINGFMHKVGRGFSKHSPGILTGLGIAGSVTALVLAVVATPKAIKLIQKKENEIDADLTPKEIVQTTWKCYIPAAVTEAASIACIVGASATNYRRNAALAAAYSLSETALREYREKVVDVIGEKKEQAVRDAIHYDHIEKNPPKNNEVIVTGKGEALCYEPISGRYFKSDIDKVRKAVINLNERMINGSEMYVSLNDYFYELGLPPTSVIGDGLGWNVNRGKIEVSYSSILAEDGTPCLVIEILNAPMYDYRL